MSTVFGQLLPVILVSLCLGSIESRGGGYRVRWREEGRARSRQFSRKSDAVRFQAKVTLERQRYEDRPSKGEGMTLNHLVEELFFPDYRPTVTVKTARDQERWYRLYISPTLGELLLWSITYEETSRFRSGVVESLGPTEARKVVSLFKQIWKWAYRRSYVDDERPGESLKRPRVPRRGQVAKGPTEIERLRAELEKIRDLGLRDSLFVALLAYVGVRPGEARALTFGDVRHGPERVQVHIHAQAEVLQTGSRVTKTKERWVPLCAELQRSILTERSRRGAGDSDPLIVGSDNRSPMSFSDYENWRSRRFAPARRLLGWEGSTNFRPYDCRHTAASLWLAAGVPLVNVAHWLGNSVRTCSTHYAHLLEGGSPQTIDDLDAEIARAREAAQEGAGQ